MEERSTASAPGHLTDHELYAWWLERLLRGDALKLEGWAEIHLRARDVGLTKLGGTHYTAEGWRKLCERLVNEGRCPRFWYVERGRSGKAVTTVAHLWAVAPFFARGRRTRRRRSRLEDCAGRDSRPALRAGARQGPDPRL